MDEPIIGEIKMFAGTFVPRGWAFCDGQLLPISGYEALFSILGTNYGGDGRTSFGLPDLRGRSPKHAGRGNGPGLRRTRLGEKGGREEVYLTERELPSHSHPHSHSAALFVEKRVANNRFPKGNMLALSKPDTEMYHNVDAGMENDEMASETIAIKEDGTVRGGGQPFSNIDPYLGINFIIALEGTFPSRN